MKQGSAARGGWPCLLGPAVEPGAEAAMFDRGRSSRPCLPGSASPLCSSHYCYWEEFPLAPAVCPHLAVRSVLARFGVFSSVSWSCCFIRSVARQAVFGLPGKCRHYSSNASLCLKRIFCFLGRKQHDFSPFFFGANRPPNCKYQSSLDLKTDDEV